MSEKQDKKIPPFHICDIFVSMLFLRENYGAHFLQYVKLIILPVTHREEQTQLLTLTFADQVKVLGKIL